MYCPGCGQQVAEETNFCPRCGFYFGVLRGLLVTGGMREGQQEIVQKRAPSDRQKGIRFGAKIVFISFALLPIFFGLSFLADGPAPLLVPFTCFTTGVLWMLYARLFRDPDLAEYPVLHPGSGVSARRQAMLPSPADSVGGGFRPRIDAGEVVPPSVTEHTTNFLGQK